MFCYLCGSLFYRSEDWLVCGRCGHARLLPVAPPIVAAAAAPGSLRNNYTPARNPEGRITPSDTPVMIKPTQTIMAAEATGISRNAA